MRIISPDAIVDKDVIYSRSEEVEEVIGKAPNWIVRWGITLIFLLFLLLLIISWVVKYPDVLQAKIIITTNPPPLKLVARTSGNLQLFVHEGEEIKAPTVLGFIKNSANYQDVMQMEKQLESFNYKNITSGSLKSLLNPAGVNLELGELQESYEEFLRNGKELLSFYEISFQTKQIQQLGKQVSEYAKLNYNLSDQKELFNKEFQLSKKKFEVDSGLLQQKVVAAIELDKSQSQVIQQKRVLKNAEASIITNNIEVAGLKNKMVELELDKARQEEQLTSSLLKSFKTLKSKLIQWKETYLLQTNRSGTVAFFKFWTNDQFVQKDDQVVSVVPHSQDIIGKIELPVTGSGKIKEGQQVYIHLDNYPSNQFGMLEGKVSSLSPLPNNNAYMISISLPEKLLTTYKKQIEFKQEMQGKTEIITEDLRLLERIFYQFRALWSGRT